MLQISVSRRHLVFLLIAVMVLVVAIPLAVSAADGFTDVDEDSVFKNDIAWLADAEVTKGCNPPANDKFCPGSNVTREQMSAFMHRLATNRVVDAGTVGGFAAAELQGSVGPEGPEGPVGPEGPEGPPGDTSAVEAALAALTVRVDALEAENVAQASQISTLETKNAALEATLAGVTRNGDVLLFTGMNLQVLNGTGTTRHTPNSLGNVIIGYNENDLDTRTGSHNLVIGSYHSWSSYGGIVAGYDNTISGSWSSVTGGDGNTASGGWSSVSGGAGNTASGGWSSILGGNRRTVSGDDGTYPFCGC